MKTSVRARHGARGFSFVELLVTIIIAAIAFAAMVPVFVQAQKSNASDNSRNLALSVAQGRMDKIRQLSYDQIVADAAHQTSTPNLYNGSSDPVTGFADGQFGPTASVATGAGTSRTFNVVYTVTPVPAGASAGQEQFKKVTVDVYWTGNPKPVKHTVLSTLIYRQYSGPAINTFTVSPLQYVAETGTTPEFWFIAGTPATPHNLTRVKMSARIDSPAINNTAKVDFRVLAHDGTEVLKRVVNKTPLPIFPDEYLDGTYSTQWAPTGYRDGTYTFRATAFSAGIATQGPAWEVQYELETGVPWAPEGLHGASVLSGADHAIKLTWTPPAASDIDHYQLYRVLAADVFPVDFPASSTPIAADILPAVAGSAGYVDATVVLGQSYKYRLLAVDTDADHNGTSIGEYAELSFTAGIPTDASKPSTPTNVVPTVVANTQRVDLMWGASTDDIGVTAYKVYRATSAGAAWTTGWTWVGDAAVLAPPVFSDTTVLWNQSYYYRVTAVDAIGNESDPSAVSAVATIGSQPVIPNINLTVRVVNATGTDAIVTATNIGTSTATVFKTFNKNKTESQTESLPQGSYSLTLTQNGVVNTGKTQTPFLSSGLTQPIDISLP
jgi:prepilin-type N-terminal cleavage/methylation domain-containing protein